MVIHFDCFCSTQWGQNLFVAGSCNELGGWDAEKALPLVCFDLNRWRGELVIRNKTNPDIHYKYFIKDSSGVIHWEQGKNRELKPETSTFEQFSLFDSWSVYANPQYTWESSAFTKVIFKRNSKKQTPFILPAKTSQLVEFRVIAPRIGKNYRLGIIGNQKQLGNWNQEKVLLMDDSQFPVWRVAISASDYSDFLEYKYVIVNNNGEISTWEAGENRKVKVNPATGVFNLISDGHFRFPDLTLKGAGVSIPVFSLRTKNSFGCGDFTDLKAMMDWSSTIGLKMLQVLPVNDTISTNSFLDSYPYKAISVFALHPLFLNIFKAGSLSDVNQMKEFKTLQNDLNKKNGVDYELVVKLKLRYAKLLFTEQKKLFFKEKKFLEFFKNNREWLVPYAAFSYLRDLYGTSDFNQWTDHKTYSADAILKLVNEGSQHYDDISFWYFIQFHLDKQLKEASEYGREKGVVLKGDIPIGISRYSVDAWVDPALYHFDGQAGAPPDDFSVDGQNWGFPTYNWEEMAKDNYGWWRKRLTKMSDYFDAYRIDHILGFFRIWEIPSDAFQGILGHFRPSLPISYEEFQWKGLWIDYDRFCKPYIREHLLYSVFGVYTDEVRSTYLTAHDYGSYGLNPDFNTQRKIYDKLIGKNGPEALSEKESVIFNGLIRFAAEVLLLPANQEHTLFHPRISMHSTFSYQELDSYQKDRLNDLYIDYFYRRHELFWKEQAMEKLPALVDATEMLICGEDLGMIPATVPEVMNHFGILSLEIQRMPKDPKKEFAHPADAPYLSVCTTSTHDMSTIRGWWEENREMIQRFYNQQLGHFGEIPYFAEPWVCKEIINQHLHSPAMWTVFPLQDLLAMDEGLRYSNTQSERINEPANPRHYWKYRMHLSMEELMKATKFNTMLSEMVNETGRNNEY